MATPELRQLWRELEAMFQALLNEASFRLPEPDVSYIWEYLEHNEFGVAFDLMAHVLRDSHIAVSSIDLDRIQAIGKKMNYDASKWEGIVTKPEAVR